MTAYIVCGWYTPDYKRWADKLSAGLDRLGIDRDIVAVPKLDGGWERNTLRKAAEVRRAIDRHPDRPIVFLDVDCEVLGPLDDLVNTRADVRLYIRVKRRRSSGEVKWGGIRSGTMVLNPTSGARELVDLWVAESEAAHYGDVDQSTLAIALAKASSTSYAPMPLAYCATIGDKHPYPIILHDSASKDTQTISGLRRRLTALVKLKMAA